MARIAPIRVTEAPGSTGTVSKLTQGLDAAQGNVKEERAYRLMARKV